MKSNAPTKTAAALSRKSATRRLSLLLSLALIAIAVVAVLACTGCSGPRIEEPAVNAQDTVSAAIDEFKAGNVEGFYSYMNLSDAASKQETDESQVFTAQVLGPKVTYKILSSEEDLEAGTATVKVEIVSPDSQAIYDRAVKLAKDSDTDPTKLTEDEAAEWSRKLFKKAAGQVDATETSTVTVDLGLVDGEEDGTYSWKITNDTLYDPLFGKDVATEDAN